MVEITSEEKNKVKRMKRTDDSLRNLWHNIKCTNIQIIGVPEEEKKKKYEKNFEEIRVENFPNMEKETVNQVQEAQRVPYRINARRNKPRHILIKLTKIKHKERILKAAREKQQVTYKGNPISLAGDLSAGQKGMAGYIYSTKRENLQPRLLYLARISFKLDRNKKLFRQAKIKRIQYHQTSFTVNVKGTYGQEIQEKKKIYKINPKQLENGNRNIYVNNYFKIKWIKYSNQKTQTG